MNFATLNRFTPLLQSPEHYGMSPPYYRGVPFFRLVSVWTALEIIVTFGGTDWGPQRADDGAARGTPAGYPARRITASLKMLYPVWALPTWPHRFPFSSPAQITPGMGLSTKRKQVCPDRPRPLQCLKLEVALVARDDQGGTPPHVNVGPLHNHNRTVFTSASTSLLKDGLDAVRKAEESQK